MDHLLAVSIALPLGSALIVGLIPGRWAGAVWRTGLILAGCELLLVSWLCAHFDPQISGRQWIERWAWMPSLGIDFHVGVDGLNLPFMVLTTLLSLLSLGNSEREKGVYVAVLTATGAAIGAFAAIDLFLFCFCYELVLVSLLLLIGGWGGAHRRHAVSRMLHILSGSALLWIAVLYLAHLYQQTAGEISFALSDWRDLDLPLGVQKWLLGGFLAGFSLCMGLVPLHTWLREAQIQAPPAGRVLLAGVWLNIGGYGLLRLCLTLFPDALSFFQDLFLWIALAGVIYGALLALGQLELKRWIVCISISQMGLVMLGISALNGPGVRGSVVLLISHGLSVTALWFIAAMCETQERSFQRERSSTVLVGCFLVAALAAAGLPGSSGFAGILLIVVGGIEGVGETALIAGLGIALLVVGVLRMGSRLRNEARSTVSNKRALITLFPLLLCIVWIGFSPQFLLETVSGPVDRMLVRVDRTIQKEKESGEAREGGADEAGGESKEESTEVRESAGK